VTDALKLIQMISERSREAQKAEKGSTDYRRLVPLYIESLPSRFFEETLIDSAADRLDIPRRTFTKLFAEIADDAWLQYLHRLAIEHAQRRLRGTDIPMTFDCL